jgi:hypothetical protein
MSRHYKILLEVCIYIKYISRDLDIRNSTYMIDKFLGRHVSCLAVAFRASNYLYHHNTQAEYVKLVGNIILLNEFRRAVSTA